MVQIWLAVSVIGLALVFYRRRRTSAGVGLHGADWVFFAAPFVAIAIPAIGTFFSVNTSLVPLSGNGLVVALSVPILVTALVGVLLGAGRLRLMLPAVMLSLLCAIGVVSAAATGQGSAQPLIGIVLAIGLSVIPSRANGLEALVLGAKAALISISLALLILTALAPVTIGVCRADKCSVLAGAVLEIGDSGNSIGLFLLALVPIVAWGMSPIRLLFFAAFLMIQFDLAAARSSMIGLALCLATFFIGAIARSRRSRGFRFVALPTLIALSLSLVPVFGRFDASAFTQRGSLWNRARELIAESPIGGYGPAYWSGQSSTSSVTANYSPHNIWLEVAVSLGVFGVIITVVALASLLIASPPENRLISWAYLAGTLGAGMLEATFTPYRLTILMSSLPIFLVLLAATQKQTSKHSGSLVVSSTATRLAGEQPRVPR